MSALRSFPQSTEQYSRSWRDCLETEDTWEIIGNPGEEGGESKGFFVRSGDLRGFAKPSNVRPDKFRAGHEKIAADLAFELGLPIPPVVLWHRSVTDDDKEEPYIGISMMPFSPIFKWGSIEKDPDRAARVSAQLSPVASAMVAFDTWIDNKDRNNKGNLLANEELVPAEAAEDEQPPTSTADSPEKGDDPPVADAQERMVRAAYIDLSYSMSYQWDGQKYKNIAPAPRYPKQTELMRDGLERMVAAIEALPDKTVRNVVKRIPNTYLTQERREIVLEGLMYRKCHLRDGLKDLLQDPQGADEK